MSKFSLWIISCICICIVGLFFWIKMPNTEEKKHHRAIFCNVIKQPETKFTTDELFDKFQFYFENSTPGYAYKKAKFHENYAKKIVQNYLQLTPQQQNVAKQNFYQCINLLEK